MRWSASQRESKPTCSLIRAISRRSRKFGVRPSRESSLMSKVMPIFMRCCGVVCIKVFAFHSSFGTYLRHTTFSCQMEGKTNTRSIAHPRVAKSAKALSALQAWQHAQTHLFPHPDYSEH